MTDLEKLWERLRIMNRSLEEDKRCHTWIELELIRLGADSDDLDQANLDYQITIAKQEQLNEIMEIVEGMMDDDKD